MASEIALIAVSLSAAVLLGFAAHRGSICNVKAVEEVLTTRRGYLFLSFGKTILWSLVVTLILLLLTPVMRAEDTLSISVVSLSGAFVCGVGMAINGSCAFATLSRLGEGDARMAVALAAFFTGATLALLMADIAIVPGPVLMLTSFDAAELWVQGLLVATVLWAAWELIRLIRTRPPGATFLSGTYRLSTASLFIGVTNGLLFSLYGNWTYTATLVRGARELTDVHHGVEMIDLAFFGALLCGMSVSAWQRRSFRFRFRPGMSWLRSGAGGLLMGFGAVLVPGGNDSLLLHGIPNLSLQAALAYLAMVLGIFAVLAAMRLIGCGVPRIDCRGDICRTV